jgi:hypothetical protein
MFYREFSLPLFVSKTYLPPFSRFACAALRSVLREYENAATDLTASGITKELLTIQSTHDMVGFPVHLPHTDSAEFIERIKVTHMHEYDAPDAEFALAAYVHAFPNRVYSTWIYIATLTRSR